MRVTQRSMYSSYIDNMQSTLSAYMESNMQGSTQKKINRPSDDPAGMALVLNTRNDIARSTQYEKNADTAEGWLDLAQYTLGNSVSKAIANIKTLAEQAATGTYTAEQRKGIATELRGLFGQVLNLSNTEFGDKSLFGGHRYDESAFDEILAVSTRDENLKDAKFDVTGKAEYTQLVEFTTGGDLADDPQVPMAYRWSSDGGKTWTDGTTTPVAGSNTKIDLDDGVVLTLPAEGTISPYVPGNPDAEPDPIKESGTRLMIRPTAFYNGDDNDRPPDTVNMGGPSDMKSVAAGTFKDDVLVRFDENVNLTVAGDFLYSYSEDNGASWIQATGTTDGSTDVRLTVPGGYVDVETTVTNPTIDKDTQILISPNRADLGYEIMDNTYISVNSVGKDFFGGRYEYPVDPDNPRGDKGPPQPIEGLEGNLFETIGDLIGYCETNDQSGIESTLEKLTDAHEGILTEAARMGGLDNRIELAQDVLSFQKMNKYERLSYTEDVDLTELLTKMTQQQLAYNTVLQSSATIMQMNLSKYL